MVAHVNLARIVNVVGHSDWSPEQAARFDFVANFPEANLIENIEISVTVDTSEGLDAAHHQAKRKVFHALQDVLKSIDPG